MPKLTPEARGRIPALYQSGLDYKAIGREVGCTGETIRYHVKAMGLHDPERYRVSDAEREDIVRLYQGGVPHAEIGRRYGITPWSVTDRLKRWGIPLEGPARRRFNRRRAIEDRDIIATYRRLRHVEKTANVYGVSEPTITAVLRRNDVPLVTDVIIDRIYAEKDLIHKQYYEVGASLEELAREYEVSQSCIHNKFSEWGWKARDATFADTSIERWTAACLTDLEVLHEKQFKLGRKLYDFHVPRLRLLIECNGDYWHANPTTYPDDTKLDKTQREGRKRDAFKTQLAQKHGYWLLFVWELDIKKRPEWVRASIAEALRVLTPFDPLM